MFGKLQVFVTISAQDFASLVGWGVLWLRICFLLEVLDVCIGREAEREAADPSWS